MRGRKPVVRTKVLNTLFESRKALTAKEIGCSPVVAGRLAKEGYIVHVDELHRPQRGRPQFRYKLSDDSRNEVRKARRRRKPATA